ncbi:hypothetical protein PGIGA_G00136610 [Pangasianodon gigas]|uniref:Uncharacterized protein n=1 Tax=Pangasianodon gigas TaxID=30993 RepID=A0ACC5XM36_PANGG|nr:hypothetical protein [Pangasianodon gigas]
MHLLGTSVLVFLLLPLVFSCKSTKTKEEISRDYEYIIQKQLEHINLSIQRQVESCGERKLVLQNLSPIDRICTVSCERLPRNINGQLQTELPNLMRDINLSLGCLCRCPAHQPVRWSESQSLQKKFCRLKRLLMTIQKAYEQYNSA